MRHNAAAAARLTFIVLSVTTMAACGDWFVTFARQPSIHPWQVATMDSARRDSTPPRGNPRGSVPLYGSDIPEWVLSYGPFPVVLDSLRDLPNPTPVTDESINRGHRYYQTTCVVCHGDTGAGDGLMTTAKGGQFPSIPIISDSAKAKTDGYIFAIIRNGRGLMPSYNRIEGPDRWDVVNYVRGLQGKLGRAVPTGPLGVPGETGDKLPGATTVAPQRGIPHFPPSRIGGGQ
jgi:mono/diheme cytochrome c family protein